MCRVREVAPLVVCLCVFFFKQKTAYEITYGDWSSDVCSSDLCGSGRRSGRRFARWWPHHRRHRPAAAGWGRQMRKAQVTEARVDTIEATESMVAAKVPLVRTLYGKGVIEEIIHQ